MADRNRIEPNVYELFLLRMILRLDGGVGGKIPLTDTDYSKMADSVGVSNGRIRKIFGQPREDAEARTLNFNPESFDILISNLKIEGVTKWSNFVKNCGPDPRLDFKANNHIPKAHFEQLSDEWKRKIAKAVNRTLQKIYSSRKRVLDDFNIFEISKVPNEEISEKLEKYLNKVWYAYLYFPLGDSYPQLARTVIKTTDHPSLATTETVISHHRKLNNFKGSVRFDKSETVLIFDMISQENNERGLHLKMLVGTTAKPPEIALGEYSNIGLAGQGLHSIRVVLEHLDPEKVDLKKVKPHFFRTSDPEFKALHPALLKYLSVEKENFRQTPKEPIFSYYDLANYVERLPRLRFVNKRIRIKPNFQVAFSSPRYNLDEGEFEKYDKPLVDIKKILEDELNFEVDAYYLSKENPDLLVPREYKFYSERIERCEILFVFLFRKNARECNSELTMATEMGKRIYILAPSRDFLPETFSERFPENINRDYYKDLDSLVPLFKERVRIHFEKELQYQMNLIKANENND